MKVLLIGGTGRISLEITRLLSLDDNVQVYLLNRGNRNQNLPRNITLLKADIKEEKEVKKLLESYSFDVVADFIAFDINEIERNIRLFSDKTKQYIFISSASAYQKPVISCCITESTPLKNPYWEYSRNKIACEDRLIREYRQTGFPITIVRPSHTYDIRNVPVCIHGKNGGWQTIKRMLENKPVIIPGDGTSLWTLTSAVDFAKGFIGLLGNNRAIGHAVHITSDETLTWNQIYDCIADTLSVKLNAVHIASDFLVACNPELYGPLLGDKANSSVFDNTKIKNLVPGFSASTRFDQGVRETIRNMLEQKSLQIEDKEFDCWCDQVIAAYQDGLRNTIRQLR